MSRDQKPGRMRVVGGETPPVQPAAAAQSETVAEIPAAGETAASLLLPVILFLIACAIGGSAVVLLRLA